MPRTKSLDNIRRDEKIYALFLQKESPAKIAERFGITPRRVLQILASFHPEAEEDTDRAVHRARLELLYEEVQSMLMAPGFKLAPNGRLAADNDGEPILDVGIKVEVAKVQLQVLESMRKLDARDKPQNVRHSVEFYAKEKDDLLAAVKAQKAADDARMRELEARARNAAVVPGEIVKELPPGEG